MSTSPFIRTFVPILALAGALAGALACRTPSKPPHADPQPAQPQPPLKVEPPPKVQPTPAQPAAVEDEFQKLLAGMGVHYFAAEKKLEIGGWVNMQTGLVEVFACSPKGKTHESVVVLDCVPSGLQAGLLALGLEPGTPVEMGTGAAYKPPTGDPVLIEVRWHDASGAEHTARAEDWIWDKKIESAMPRKPWIFAGSFMQPVAGGSDTATFAADYIKSLVTTYHDSTSILENPHSDGIDDELYFSNDKAVPPVGTPITAVFRSGK